jgi:hypothetical protein
MLFMAPSRTLGAVMPVSRRAPVKVVVFQWPWGMPARQRSPRGARPRRRAIFVDSTVSSMKTSLAGSSTAHHASSCASVPKPNRRLSGETGATPPIHYLTNHQVLKMRRNVRRSADCQCSCPRVLRIISERIEPGEQARIAFPG